MNKRQAVITFLLIGLMVVLGVAQTFFENNFERIASSEIVENNTNYSQYNFESYTLMFPDEWDVKEENLSGCYISYDLKFRSPDGTVTGSVEVLNTKEDAEKFAENDFKKLNLNSSDNEISSFESKECMGVLSKYETKLKSGSSYSNECYYIKGSDGQLLKILFNISKDQESENAQNECADIVTSLKISNPE